MDCQICKKNLAKYKCSNCYKPYCSVNCWKNHKSEDICEAVQSKEKIQSAEEEEKENKKKYFTEDTVPEEKLMALRESEVLRKILKNKYLQQTLMGLDKSSQPEKDIVEAMKDPEFVEFVDECMKIVEDDVD